MFKVVFLTLFFSSALIVVIQPSYSQQLLNNLAFPPSSLRDNPVCMMQMENGTILNLSSMCGKASNSDRLNDAAAQKRAFVINQFNQICKRSDITDPEMKQLCEKGLP